MNVLVLHVCLGAVGCDIHGCDSSGTVQWAGIPNEPLAALVVAAHDKALASDEGQALKTYLGAASAEWKAYKDARKAPIQEKRKERYRNETDELFNKSFETTEGAKTIVIDGVTCRCPSEAKIAVWEAKKNSIRQELPYPEE